MDPEIEPNVSLTEEEAVEIIEGFLAEKSAGMEETTSEYARTYQEEISLNVQCNQQIADSYYFTNNGSVVQADYKYNWNFTLNCSGLSVPQSAVFSSTGSGTYTTARIASDDSSTFTATVTGLQPSSSTMIFNATYQREGTQQLTTNQNTRSLSSDFNASIVDLIIGKSDFEVESGTGSFTLSGSTNQGNFNYDGSLVFNGDNTATITINGNQYTIDLN
ncbi:hypothetical protein [Aquiflexum gelatinilyticum]|uniref:hypothetical protein n=1 Tax=Aquiflexum gelatinilyticum TaxID=2961943 RepID=UPI002167435B|nr:hypothetical protein [Aquiflexum gelatinilyticum]MCS4436678.1 hypothetical protein [Aquiflexum gelatinilyticum]